MEIRSGINLSLSSIARTYQSSDGTIQKKTYHAGDPEFDTYVAEQKKKREEAETSLPKNFMLDAVGQDGTSATLLGRKLSDAFVQYYDGSLDQRGVEAVIQETVSSLRSSYMEKGFDAEEFMPKLLRDVYERVRTDNIYGVGVRSAKDARELAAHYNGDDRNSKDFIYYDAKYYYQSEEMKGTVLEIMQRVARQYDVSDMEFPEGFEDGDIRKGIYASYNTQLNQTLRHDFLVGNMLDETMAPPEGFRFFYKGNASGTNRYEGLPSSDGTPESAFDGVLHVQYGDWSLVGRVPVRQDAARFPVSVNMYDFVSQRKTSIPDAIVPMMKNFDFFTETLSSIYLREHPRNL